jgi:hypothetical protein
MRLVTVVLALLMTGFVTPSMAQGHPYRTPYAPPTYSLPQSGSTFDWRSGNLYNWHGDSTGTTHINGFNSRSGTTRDSQVESNGNQSGRDSAGNYGNYNSSNGRDRNFWTGKTCFGSGAARHCY